MAVRTIRRYPRTVDTDDYYNDENQGYFNFTSFNGINSNKNYISIDQQSFEDAKNMYVDQNGQLSTRPPVRRINILPFNETVVELIKVNNLVIYHTYDGTNYHIRFQYDGYWFANLDGDDYKVGNKVVVSWFQDKYIVFTVDNFFAFSYNYERAKTQPDNAIDWFIAEDIVYIPVQNVGGNEEASQENNIFTTASITRYVFEKGVSIDTLSLLGKTVTVRIDNETFSIKFEEHNEQVFTKPIGSVIATRFQVSQTHGNMLAEDDEGTVYYSNDGVLFEIFDLAYTGSSTNMYCLSDDGGAVYQSVSFSYAQDGSNWIQNVGRIYYMDLESNNFVPSSWQTINVNSADTFNIKMNQAIKSNKLPSGISPFSMSDQFLVASCTPVTLHSPRKGSLIVGYSGFYGVRYYKNENPEWNTEGALGGYDEETGTDYSLFNERKLTIAIVNDLTCYVTPLLVLPSINSSYHNSIKLIYNADGRCAIMMAPYLQNGNIVDDSYNIFLIRFDENYKAFGNVSFDITTIDIHYPSEQLGVTIARLGYNPLRLIQENVSITSSLSNNAYRIIYNEGILNFIFAYNNGNDYRKNITVSGIQFIPNYNVSDYSYEYIFQTSDENIDNWGEGVRETFPWTCSSSQAQTILSSEYASSKFVMSDNTNTILTDLYYYYDGGVVPLIRRTSEAGEQYPIIPLVAMENEYGTMMYYSNNSIYSNNYSGQVFVDLSNSGIINYILPEHIETFIGAMSVKVFNVENKLYWTSTEGDVGKLYVKENDVYEFEDYITNIVTFSQTSLGIFLEDNVYEFMYDSTNSVYRVAATKLQLGCKRGSDVLLSYDGSSILLTTIKGLSSLSYQDFVQSTEQIYTYLTENIMDLYDEYSVSPIKLYQYKNWLFMYRQDSNKLYIYDTRNTSWWCWEYEYNVQQIMFDGTNLLIVLNGYLENVAFDIESVYDDETNPFDWYFISQKLHFNAPNYYKHIRQVAVITSQNGNRMRYKLTFKNYRNLNNLVNSDTVEFDIEQLNTLIKRVAFMKTNAFQFKISNDDTNPKPMAFIIPDIAIKYRVTEMIR